MSKCRVYNWPPFHKVWSKGQGAKFMVTGWIQRSLHSLCMENREKPFNTHTVFPRGSDRENRTDPSLLCQIKLCSLRILFCFLSSFFLHTPHTIQYPYILPSHHCGGKASALAYYYTSQLAPGTILLLFTPPLTLCSLSLPLCKQTFWQRW